MNVVEIASKRPEKSENIRIAAYCRVSSDSADQLHSFAAQIRHYKDYERTHPQYKLIDVYADEGLSGVSMKKRDELQRLIRDCQKGKIDRVIVKSVSRLARNTEDMLKVIRLLNDIGVSVYFEEQDIDTDKLNMEMLVTFPGMVAQQESVGISENMRWSYKKRMESGEYNTTYPAFGYALVDNQLIINETEAVIVRLIFDLYLKGIGMQRIASTLNADGILSRNSSGKWYQSTIHYILKNERYMGDALLQKSFTTESLPFKKRRNHGEAVQYYVENSNAAIVSHDVFMAAQRLLKSRSNNVRTQNRGNFPLSRILRCSECGRTFRRHIASGTACWECTGRDSGVTNCRSHRVKEASVYNAFGAMMFKLAQHRKELLGSCIRQLEQLRGKNGEISSRLSVIDKQIADFAAQNLAVARLHAGGILNAAEYAAQSSDIGKKISTLRTERMRLLADDENDQMLDALRELSEILEEYQPTNVDFDEALFAQLVQNITVVSNCELIFSLTCGLTLTEIIPEKGRCNTK